MKTETTFPIVFGTLVKVICDTGYELKGSNTIACYSDTKFTFVEQPACKDLGKSLDTASVSYCLSKNSKSNSLYQITCMNIGRVKARSS